MRRLLCLLGRHEPWTRAIAGGATRCVYCDAWVTVGEREIRKAADRTPERVAEIEAAFRATVERRR